MAENLFHNTTVPLGARVEFINGPNGSKPSLNPSARNFKPISIKSYKIQIIQLE